MLDQHTDLNMQKTKLHVHTNRAISLGGLLSPTEGPNGKEIQLSDIHALSNQTLCSPVSPAIDTAPLFKKPRKSKPFQSPLKNDKNAAPGYIIQFGIGWETPKIVQIVNYEPLPDELRPSHASAYCNKFKKSPGVGKKQPSPKRRRASQDTPTKKKARIGESPNLRSRRARQCKVSADELENMVATDSSIDVLE